MEKVHLAHDELLGRKVALMEELYSFADFVSAVAEEGHRCEAGRSGSRAAC